MESIQPKFSPHLVLLELSASQVPRRTQSCPAKFPSTLQPTAPLGGPSLKRKTMDAVEEEELPATQPLGTPEEDLWGGPDASTPPLKTETLAPVFTPKRRKTAAHATSQKVARAHSAGKLEKRRRRALSVIREPHPKGEKGRMIEIATAMLKENPKLEAPYRQLGATYAAQENFPKAIRHLKAWEKVIPESNPLIRGDALGDLGRFHVQAGDYEKAEELHQERLGCLRWAEASKLEIEKARVDLADARIGLEATTAGLFFRNQAHAALDKICPVSDSDRFSHALSLGKGHLRLKNIGKAIHHLVEAIKVGKKLDKDPRMVEVLNLLGKAYDEKGSPKAAMHFYLKAAFLSKDLYPKEDHPQLIRTLDSLRVSCEQLKMTEKAKECDQYIRQILAQSPLWREGAEKAAQGQKLIYCGKFKESIEVLTESHMILSRFIPQRGHPKFVYCLGYLGYGLLRMGRREKAIERLTQCVQMGAAFYPGGTNFELVRAWSALGDAHLGIVLYEQGDATQADLAINAYNRAIADGKKHKAAGAVLIGVAQKRLEMAKKAKAGFEAPSLVGLSRRALRRARAGRRG